MQLFHSFLHGKEIPVCDGRWGYSAGSTTGCMDFPCRAGEQSECTAGNVSRVERVNYEKDV